MSGQRIVIKAKRLEALEADTLAAWRAAWAVSADAFYKHMGGLTISSADLRRTVEVELADLTDEATERAAAEFLRRIGVTQFDVFAAWFKSYEIPDPDADRPDLSTWPQDVPEPPDEPPGEWERVLPFMVSDDLVEQLAAQVFLSLLVAARTAREGRASAIAR